MNEEFGKTVEGTLHSADGVGVVLLKVRYDTGVEDVWSALTDPGRLARWFGKVSGDLRSSGDFSAYVYASEWDGHGHVEACVLQRQLRVSMWEEEGVEQVTSAELSDDDGSTNVTLDVRGVPVDLAWAYGAGWQIHLEDLGAHLVGRDRDDTSSSSDARFGELELHYRALAVEPLRY